MGASPETLSISSRTRRDDDAEIGKMRPENSMRLRRSPCRKHAAETTSRQRLHGRGSEGSVRGSWNEMALNVEGLWLLREKRESSLLTRRSWNLHFAFSSSGRLTRILRPVVSQSVDTILDKLNSGDTGVGPVVSAAVAAHIQNDLISLDTSVGPDSYSLFGYSMV
jgi:hypothetical protein